MTKPFTYTGTGDEIDQDAAWDYIRNGYLLSPRTVLKGRSRLPRSIGPIAIDLNKISPYVQTVLKTSMGQMAGQTRAIMFTGGFDSLLICQLAIRSGAAVKAVTVQFDEFNPCTVQGAVECAQRMRFEHHILHVSVLEFLTGFEELVALTDEPLLSLDLAVVYAALKKYDPRVAGNVFISGMGSDQWMGDLSFEVKPGGFEAKFDWAILDETAHHQVARAHGCEFIFPFLSEDMITLSLSIPAEMKKDKSLLRAMAIANKIPSRGAKTEIQIPVLLRRILVKVFGDRAWPCAIPDTGDANKIDDQALRQIILGLWLENAKKRFKS
jgi:asparagine synthetase B (glutamine-hydrolysing)